MVDRQTYTAVENGDGTYTPIPPKTWIIENSHVLQIGVKSSMAMPSWYTGAWVAQRLLMLPSTTSEFIANVQTCNYRLRLGVLNLVTFPKHQSTWMLYVKIPKWIKQALVEIWRYDGRDETVFDLGADDIQAAQFNQTTETIVFVAANPNRKGVVISNKGSEPLVLSTGVTLEADAYYETPFGFSGQITGAWVAPGAGYADVRDFL
ncbi:MAG: hypothetical protein IGS48_02445 [Oscillatoriales cyanobacterium C42_A2020_001]|nr:hypothetical protein [Leptolyngbyaceae cyanobacterium C42_A2020_001]